MLLDSAEVMLRLGIDRKELEALMKSGRLPFARTAGGKASHFRFKESDVQALEDGGSNGR